MSEIPGSANVLFLHFANLDLSKGLPDNLAREIPGSKLRTSQIC